MFDFTQCHPQGSNWQYGSIGIGLAWRRTGNEPLPGSMMNHFSDAYKSLDLNALTALVPIFGGFTFLLTLFKLFIILCKWSCQPQNLPILCCVLLRSCNIPPLETAHHIHIRGLMKTYLNHPRDVLSQIFRVAQLYIVDQQVPPRLPDKLLYHVISWSYSMNPLPLLPCIVKDLWHHLFR